MHLLKPRVAIFDHDEVLAPYIMPLLKYCKDNFGMQVEKKDITSYDLGKIFKIPRQEVNRVLFAFEASPEFMAVRPYPFTLSALLELRPHFDKHVTGTARRHELMEITEQITREYLPGGIDEIVCTNEPYNEGQPANGKGKLCQGLNAKFLAEDNLQTCLAVAQLIPDAEVYVIDQPWNQTTDELPRNVFRVSNLAAVPRLYYRK